MRARRGLRRAFGVHFALLIEKLARKTKKKGVARRGRGGGVVMCACVCMCVRVPPSREGREAVLREMEAVNSRNSFS